MNSTVMRRVAKEMKELMATPLEGITVIPNEMDLTEVSAVVTGPADTPFEGGLFKIRLKLGSDFPSAPPKGFFITKVFHPNVAPSTGEICVNTLKKDWKDSYGIQHILLAGKLLLEHYDQYAARARTFTQIHAQPKKEAKEKDKEQKYEDKEEKEQLAAPEEQEEKFKPLAGALQETKPKAVSTAPQKAAAAVSKPQAQTQPTAKRGLKRL